MSKIPLTVYIPSSYLPVFFRKLVENIVFTREDFRLTDIGWELALTLGWADNGNPIDHLVFPDPSVSLIAISFDRINTLTITKTYDYYSFRYDPAHVKILLPSLFKKAIVQDNKLVIAPIAADEDPRASIDIGLQDKFIEFNTFNGLNFVTANLESFIPQIDTAFVIGETGIGIVLDKVIFNVSADGLDITIKSGKLYLPQKLGLIPNIEIHNGTINKDGFTGELIFDWELTFNDSQKLYQMNGEDVRLFNNFTGGLDSFAIIFEKNTIKSCTITGELLLPYFDQAANNKIRITITLDNQGEIGIFAKSATGGDISISKEELLNLSLKELALEVSPQTQTISLRVSGGLEPLLFATEGMKWPRMDVKNLKIDETGKFSIDEAWLDLREVASLDLFGFYMELRKIGIGTLREQGTDKLWVDLSGGIKLIEQVPIGVDVEGFRIIWPQQLSVNIPITTTEIERLSSAINIQFKGVQLSFGVPGAIQLDGLIRFFKDSQATGFAGDMLLVIPPAGITAEAGLMIGIMQHNSKPLPFFYVYFGLESMAGIPLGQSGLALKGAIGLFGINVRPNRQPNQHWYYDWYKKAPAPGAHQTTKWEPAPNALAVGAGVTITTTDGVIKGTKGIFVLAMPGPVIVINGKALILDGLNPDPNAEPPFSATAIFDGNEKIIQFNLEAQAEIVKDVLDAYAPAEIFFDFKDITNWHLYLGQNQPQERRIKANVLKIIEADAYLMLDMLDADSPRSRMGASTRFKPRIDPVCFPLPIIGDECIFFDARVILSGDGSLSVQPAQISASASLDASIKISALGFEVDIGAHADISIEGPTPFSLQGNLNLYANLPEPLPDYNDTFKFELNIPENKDIQINDPFLSASMFHRFNSTSKAVKVYKTDTDALDIGNLSEEDKSSIPVVECDISPILTFEHEMNQECNFVQHPGGEKTYDIGAIRVKPILKSIVITEVIKEDNTTPTIIYDTKNPNLNFYGTWLAESDPATPDKPASRRLQLLSNNPLSNTVHAPTTESPHLSARILEDHPDLMFCNNQAEPIKKCVDFKLYDKSRPIDAYRVDWNKLIFESTNKINLSSNIDVLRSKKYLKIIFPEKISKLNIRFVKKAKEVDVTAFSYPLYETPMRNIRIIDQPDFIEVRSENQGFDTIILSETSEQDINIQAICYVSHQSSLDFINNQETCNTNKNTLSIGSISNQLYFKPYCYYQIEVNSEFLPEIIYSKITEKNEIIKNLIIEKYNLQISRIPESQKSFIYFQTESPPRNLEPYLKWSIPEHQKTGVYLNDPLVFRFKRDYIGMFYHANISLDYRAEFYLKDADGNLASLTDIEWSTANAGTLFPDEETWSRHLNNNGIVSANKKDTLVKIKASAELKKNSRYEIIMIANRMNNVINEIENDEKNIMINDRCYTVLLSKKFTTSQFDSFRSLIASVSPNPQIYDSEINNLKITPIIIEGQKSIGLNIAIFNRFKDKIIDVEKEFFITSIDYEYGIASLKDNNNAELTGKEALEKSKLNLRKFRYLADAEFNNFASKLNSEIFFRDEKNRFAAYFVNYKNNDVSFLWLKFPESQCLQLNERSLGYLNIEVSYAGIYKFSLYEHGIYNSDCSQVVFNFGQKTIRNTIDEIKKITIRFVLRKDIQNSIDLYFPVENKLHHRYDRDSAHDKPDEIIELGFE